MRKFLCTMLCLMLVFTMMPMATGVAFAEASKFSVGGVEVIDEHNGITTTGTSWEYDCTSNTLTLTGGTIEKAARGIDYNLATPLNIIVSGTNNINVTKCGIYSGSADVNITIEEGATLTIGTITDIASWTDEDAYTLQFGIKLCNNNATIANYGTLNIFDTDYGVLGKDISIVNNGDINIYNYGDEEPGAINAEGNLMISASNETNMLNINSARISGIYVDGATTFTNINTSIMSYGPVGVVSGTFDHISGETNVIAPIGIVAGDINLIGGKVTATGTEANGDDVNISAGIYAMGGTLNIPSNSNCIIKTTALGTNSNLELGIGGTFVNIEDGFSGSIESNIYAEGEMSSDINAYKAFAPIASGMPAISALGGSYPPTLTSLGESFNEEAFDIMASSAINTELAKGDRISLASLTDGIPQGIYKHVKIVPTVKYNWTKLANAMAGESQMTVPNVFEVTDNSPTAGTRTIKLLTDITAEEGNKSLKVSSKTNIVLDLNGKTLDRGLKEKAAVSDGNAIKVGEDASLKVMNGKITGSNPSDNNGALRGDKTKELNLINVSFIDCKGSALSLSDVKCANIEHCTFTGNTGANGGAIDIKAMSVSEEPKVVTITDSVFKNNRAITGSGSVIRIYGDHATNMPVFRYADVTIINSTFTDNVAEKASDASTICAYRLNSLVLDGCTITSNTAVTGSNCAGFSIGGWSDKLTIKGKTIIKNNTVDGKTEPFDMCLYSTDKTTFKVEGLDPESRIGIKLKSDIGEGESRVLVEGFDAGYKNCFFVDDPRYQLSTEAGKLMLTMIGDGESGYVDPELYQKMMAEITEKQHVEEVAEIKDAVDNTIFKAVSTKQTKLNGKKAIKITWSVIGGKYDLKDFEGFDIYRSTKKSSGYSTKPFFTTTKWSYLNNKDLKVGQTYYYKVRAWKTIDGEKYYTGWSTKAHRTVK